MCFLESQHHSTTKARQRKVKQKTVCQSTRTTDSGISDVCYENNNHFVFCEQSAFSWNIITLFSSDKNSKGSKVIRQIGTEWFYSGSTHSVEAKRTDSEGNRFLSLGGCECMQACMGNRGWWSVALAERNVAHYSTSMQIFSQKYHDNCRANLKHLVSHCKLTEPLCFSKRRVLWDFTES